MAQSQNTEHMPLQHRALLLSRDLAHTEVLVLIAALRYVSRTDTDMYMSSLASYIMQRGTLPKTEVNTNARLFPLVLNQG